MKESDYKPFILNSFYKKENDYYILGILPNNNDEDFYYEIHLKTKSPIIEELKYYIEDHIYIDFISTNRIEIYIGEYYENSSTDGDFEYISYSYEKNEKINKEIWKPKFYSLRRKFREVFDQKVKLYADTRKKVIDSYKKIYDEEIKNCSKEDFDMLNKGSLFKILYYTFDSNPSWDSFNKLINPNYKYYPPTKKDWKDDYSELEQVYLNLKNTEPQNYQIVKNHMIDLYKRQFEYWLHNHKDIDEETFRLFFFKIIEKLKQTEE